DLCERLAESERGHEVDGRCGSRYFDADRLEAFGVCAADGGLHEGPGNTRAAHLRVDDAFDDADVPEQENARISDDRYAAREVALVLLGDPADLPLAGHGNRQILAHQY